MGTNILMSDDADTIRDNSQKNYLIDDTLSNADFKKLSRVQLLRARPEAGAAILLDQMLEPLDVAPGVGELGLHVAAARRFGLRPGPLLGRPRPFFGQGGGLGLDVGPHLRRQRAQIRPFGHPRHANIVTGEVVSAHTEDDAESIRRSRCSYPSRRYPPPVETVEQRLELRPRQPHHPVLDPWPNEGAGVEALVDQHQAGAVPDQDLHPVHPLRAEHHRQPRMRVEAELVLHRRRERGVTAAEVHRPRRDHDRCALARHDHRRASSATTISAMRPAGVVAGNRTTTVPTTSSIDPAGGVTGSSGGSSATTSAAKAPAPSSPAVSFSGAAGSARRPWRASRRHVVTCCGISPCRRATPLTVAPGARVSPTIRPFTSGGQFRRPERSARTSRRPTKPELQPAPFASDVRFLLMPHPPANPGAALRCGRCLQSRAANGAWPSLTIVSPAKSTNTFSPP